MIAYLLEISLLQFFHSFFPSSKLCSNCLRINQNLTLNDCVYICYSCSDIMDRDVNTATNLINYCYWYAPQLKSATKCHFPVTVSSPVTLTACGDEISPSITRPSSVIQE